MATAALAGITTGVSVEFTKRSKVSREFDIDGTTVNPSYRRSTDMRAVNIILSWSCPWITIWKLVPALTTQHIMHYMNLTQPQEICISLGQMEKEEWLDPRQNPLVSK